MNPYPMFMNIKPARAFRGSLIAFVFLVSLAPLSASATTLSGGGNDEDSSFKICGSGSTITVTNGGRFQASVSLSGQMQVNGCTSDATGRQIDQQGSYRAVGNGNTIDFYRNNNGSVTYEGSLSVTGGTVSGNGTWWDANHYGGYWTVQGSGNQLMFGDVNTGWKSIVYFTDAPPTGSITTADCTIPKDSNVCTSYVSWSSQYTDKTAVYQGGYLWANVGTSWTDNPYAWTTVNGITFTLYSGWGDADYPTTPPPGGIYLGQATAKGTCISGTTADASGFCRAPLATGTITAPNCTILKDANTCTTNVSWSAQNTDFTSVYQNDYLWANVGPSYTNNPYIYITTSATGVTFKLYDKWGSGTTPSTPPTGGTLLAQVTAKGTCTAGTAADASGFCRAPTATGSITATNCTILKNANSCSSTVSWSAQNSPDDKTAMYKNGLLTTNAGTPYTNTYPIDGSAAGTNFKLYSGWGPTAGAATLPPSPGGVLLGEVVAKGTCETGTTLDANGFCKAPLATGTITAPNCTILKDANTCTTNVSWSAQNTDFTSVYQNDYLWANVGPSYTNNPYIYITTSATGVTFKLYDKWGSETTPSTPPTGGTLLAQVTAKGTCTAGTAADASGFCRALLPDLTTGLVSATAAVVGTPVTLSATISNIGNIDTDSGFSPSIQWPTLFQVATAPGGGGTITDVTPAPTNGRLAAGANVTPTVSYTFPSAGTYSIRACADKASAGDTGRITESNENNNCSAWVQVVVGSSFAASCSVSPTSGTTATTYVWTASASGGTGSYTYSWSGTDSLTGSTQSVSKTYSTTGTKTGSVTVTSGAQTVTQTCSNSVTVGVASAPDLTTGAVSPTTAVTGSATTLSATVTNIGSADTDNGFSPTLAWYTLFQVATAAGGGGTVVDVTPAPVAGRLAAGASIPRSVSYTFPSAGTYSVRACADKSSAGDTGRIPESNETNNCGAWTTVTVTTAASTLTASCSVSPTSGTTATTYVWTASASGGTGSYTYSWSGTDSLTGSTQSVSKTYSTSGTKTASVTVTSGAQTVTQGCSTSVVVSGSGSQPNLTASAPAPRTATAGTSVALTATVTNSGTAAVSGTYSNVFQVDFDSDHSAANIVIAANSLSNTAIGGTGNITANYTFASAGTFYTRACADLNTSMSGSAVAESNEGDNCGSWTTVAVTTAGGSTLTASCSVSPTSGTTATTYVWTASASGGTGSYTYSWSGTDSLTGSTQSVSKTYSTSGTKTASVTVTSGAQTVTQTCSNSVSVGATLQCSRNPAGSPLAAPASIEFTASGGTGPYTFWDGAVSKICDASPCTKTFSPGNYVITAKDSLGMTATCGGSAFSVEGTVNITANPTRIQKNTGESVLTWSSSGYASCTVKDDKDVSVIPQTGDPKNGTAKVTGLSAQTTYTITCGSKTSSVTINVVPGFDPF